MQSSTEVVPQRAVDGSTSAAFSASTCSLTRPERAPWWYVNLLEPYMVQLVRLDFGKSCCGQQGAATVVVRVGNSRPDLGSNPICNRFTGPLTEGRPLFLPCNPPMPGAFVSCYAFHSRTALPFREALAYCRARGGTLVDESNPALQGFISWELWRRHRSDSGSQYWLGAVRDPADRNNWKWLGGGDVTVSFWNLPGGDQDCARYDGAKGWLADGVRPARAAAQLDAGGAGWLRRGRGGARGVRPGPPAGGAGAPLLPAHGLLRRVPARLQAGGVWAAGEHRARLLPAAGRGVGGAGRARALRLRRGLRAARPRAAHLRRR
ncbi:uncharacterized protein GBIM_10636, partial [Gryllus bimaculatus]